MIFPGGLGISRIIDKRGYAFAAAAFADQGKCLASRYIETDILHGLCDAILRVKVVERFSTDSNIIRFTHISVLSFGSRQSRRASPKIFSASEIKKYRHRRGGHLPPDTAGKFDAGRVNHRTPAWLVVSPRPRKLKITSA